MNCGPLFVYEGSGTIDRFVLLHCALEYGGGVCQQREEQTAKPYGASNRRI
jgi:hypothetical protein